MCRLENTLALMFLSCITSSSLGMIEASELSRQCAGIVTIKVDEGLRSGNTIHRFIEREYIERIYKFYNDSISSPALAIFQISTEGRVTNRVTLDREDPRGSRFELTVLTKRIFGDYKKSAWNACSLRIAITDLNDNAPKFARDLYVGRVVENSKGTLVRGLEGIYATDPDLGTHSVDSYIILPGHGDAFVAVTETIGGLKLLNIKTLKRLDREDVSFYVLTVQASDGGNPKRNGTTQIRINVLDVNDRAPQFKPAEYSMSVLSSTPVGTSVLKVHAEDDDLGQNGEVYYYFKSTSQGFFEIEPHTGVIRVASLLDIAAFELTVTAQDRGSKPLRTEAVVRVNLVKSNALPTFLPERGARFTNCSYLVRVREDLPVKCHVLRAAVTHLTKSTVFTVLSDGALPFEVRDNSGVVYLVKPLDYETRRTYAFRLRVKTKSADVYNETNVTVQVDDVDENFHAPAFKKANFETSLRRISKPTKPTWSRRIPVEKLAASDGDKGVSGLVKYYIRDGSGAGMFTIERNLGRVDTRIGMNWQGIDQLELLVEARDCAKMWKSSTQFLIVNIEGHDDCRPEFERPVYRVSIREDVLPGAFVAVAKAKGCRKERNAVKYSITAGHFTDLFAIEKDTGIVRTTSKLDREVQHEHILEITATGRRSSKAQVFIRVQDVNDNTPEFVSKNYEIRIMENRGRVDNLLCIQARDKDTGLNGKVRYEITAGNNSNLFSINGNTGSLSSDSLNFETQKEHTLTIRAIDHGEPPRSSNTTVKIIVSDTNDPPKFIVNHDDITVEQFEGKPIGSRITFLSVFDEDMGENGMFFCSYEYIDPEDFGMFAVKTTKKGCELQLNTKNLDWFRKSVYSLRIRVTDKASPRLRKSDIITVKVKIKDINNHAPVFSQDSYWSSAPEDTPLRTSPILYVDAADKDSGLNAEIRYSIVTRTTMFIINTKDGSITANRELKEGKHKLIIQAQDKGSPQQQTNVTCYISVYRRSVSFPSFRISTRTLPEENADLKPVVAKVRLRGKLGKRFHIVGGNIRGTFKIGERNGEVRLVHALDYERVKEYKLVVRAVFKPRNSKEELAIEVPLKVKVTDINDNKPSFRISNQPFVININKRLKTGVSITRVLAFDRDSGANSIVRYHLRKRFEPVDFAIDAISGEITATTSLHSREAPYTCTVVAEDGGTPRKHAELEVQIKVHRDSEAVTFPRDQREASVSEGPLGIFTKLMTFNANNYKGENDLTYSLVTGNIEDSFCVDVTGTLYSARVLDREKRSNYVMRLSVDDGELLAYTDLNISVNDVNDNSPQFLEDPMRVFTKDNETTQRIGVVKAEDSDSGANAKVIYEIIGTSRALYRNLFYIDPNLGTLLIKGTLNHEEAPEHVLTIGAKDGGSKSYRTFGHVIVTVTDKNDNSPRFLSRIFAERILFNAPKGYLVVRTLATDKDSGLNGEIRYSMSSTSSMFTIDETTGCIHVASGLSLGTFSFLVSATDKGTPKKTGTARVNITVESPPGQPRFLHAFRGLHASVRENQKQDSHVLTVKTMSRDLVTYEIHDLGIRDFEIEAISGRIVIARPLDYERKQRYHFMVSATDRNDRSIHTHVTISIENVNDNEPRIVKNATVISCRVNRFAAIGTRVTQIHAHDGDKGDTLRFSLGKASDKKYFNIDSNGIVRTKAYLNELDPKLYISVTVEDSGKPPLRDTAIMYVVLLNYKTQSSVRAEVSEGTSRNTTLALSRAISSHHEHRSFSIVYPKVSPFLVNQTTGALILNKTLDYETQRAYSLTVRMEKVSDPSDFLDVDIEVAVKDQNDNNPLFQFASKAHTLSIDKDARAGTLVYRFKATDKDSGANGDVVYDMADNYEIIKELFNLGRKTGQLKTTGVAFKQPRWYKYNVTVNAYDRGTPASRTRTFIIVQVKYSRPEFTMENYQFEVNEDVAIGHHVGMVTARSFGVFVTYEIRGVNDKFSINPKTGNITVLGALDYEMSNQRVFVLDIIAEKTGETSHTKVTVRVKDVNDCAPRFHRQTYIDRLPESAPIGTTVLKVHAPDEDSGINGEVRYSLDTDDFSIDSYTGVVTTAATLDYEASPLYNIKVVAHDRGTPRLNGTTVLIVEVTNVNDNAPRFTSLEYSGSLWENAKMETLVTTVKAKDADLDSITYDITAGNDARTFVIDSVSGEIKLSSGAIVGPFYYLNVSASDGVHTEHTVVKVTVIDINDHAPVFSNCSEYSPTIPENSGRGTTVIKVSASDKDLGPNGEVEYAIVHANTRNMFEINGKTGFIQTVGSFKFDREKKRKYHIRVKATDGSSSMKPEERRESSCSLEVTITDENDNKPVFDNPSYEGNVKENVGIGHSVIQVKANDIDEGMNAQVSYAIKTPTYLFKIDNQTGVITTRANLMNNEGVSRLTIVARDSGVPSKSSECDVTVHVIDSNNDPPQFTQGFYDAYIPENSGNNKMVGNAMVAISKNSNHNVYYSIIPGNVPATNNPKKFEINLINGVVGVHGYLDRETTPNYTLTIQAENDANPPLSSWTILRIFLTDVNDCTPEFPTHKYDGDIPENSDVGTTVLTVEATDKDNAPYNKMLYSMSNPNIHFSIDEETGVIKSKEVFDREEIDRYSFVVKATDNENQNKFSEVYVYVTITDKNDQSPKFSERSYKAEISEDVPTKTEVKTVSASDGDLGLNARIRFDIKNGNEDDKFRILPDGRVVVNSKLDYEETRMYNLTLKASDGENEDTVVLTVDVRNENDNNPEFLPRNRVQEAEVPENSPKGTMVINLTATDRDSGDYDFNKAIKYYLGSQVERIFRIDSSTGEIRTLTKLDRETKDSYMFQAYADDGDGRTGSVEVVVRVTDVNDNAPTFPESSLVVTVHEDLRPGTPIKKIEAIDKDDVNQGGNAVIEYRLHSDPDGAFTIDASTAMLKTKIKLDRETKSDYTLIVKATDTGSPPQSSETVVVVRVLDINDHSPKFTNSEFHATIPENTAIKVTVLTLTATDEDVEENARLKFSMLNGDLPGAFQVNPLTGEVVVDTTTLNYEDKQRYEFEVKVEDGGTSPRSSTAKVIVNLQDSNDNPPHFTQPKYSFEFNEGTYTNKEIPIVLGVRDDDATQENRDVRFSISDGNLENIFKIDSETGKMFVTSSLDHEANPMHVFMVRVTNKAPPNHYGESRVTINVKDINDNAPELTNSSLNQEIFENEDGDRVMVIGTLQATDRDHDLLWKRFTFGIRGGNKMNFFRLDGKTGVLTTTETFDREFQAVYPLEIWIRDSGTPPLTSNVTIMVHILDRNDNQHREGNLSLTVNLLAQQTISPNTLVGKVFVDDSDTDDLRYYDMLTSDFDTFVVDRNSGEISLKQRPASRRYTFRVLVSDRDSIFHPVECGVMIKVNRIPTEAFTRSISIRFPDETKESLVSNLDGYRKAIAEAVDTRPENVDLFSVQNAAGGLKAVDLRFGAHGSPYYAPERLVTMLKKKRNRLTSLHPGIVIGFDACASEPCKTGGCKSKVTLTGGIDVVDDGRGHSFASVITRTDVKCGGCEELFPRETTCKLKPCLNNGTCADVPYAFQCTCPKLYRGPNCELTTRSFKKDDWVSLRPLKSCRVSTLSLEFSTLQEDGLLLYNGPTAALRVGDNYDFIAVQLYKGKVRVSLSLGEPRGTTVVVESAKLNDGEWHLVEIHRNATIVRVTVDRCRWSLKRGKCEKTHVIRKKTFNLLNINEPLQLGGMWSTPPGYTDVKTTTYEGCIKKVKDNDIMYDLKTVLDFKGSKEGCPVIDQYCQPMSPCYGDAECVPSRKGPSCSCPPGYGGRLCDNKSVAYSFNNSNGIKYRLKESWVKQFNPKFTKIELMVRTRDKDGGVLMSMRGKSGEEHLTLRVMRKISESSLVVKVIFENHVKEPTQLKGVLLGDGQWHHVTITRERNKVHLGVDSIPTDKGEGNSIRLYIDHNSEIFIGGAGRQTWIGDSFDGCIKDVRINGQSLPDKSNRVAIATKLQGVTQGCESRACQDTPCPNYLLCYDKWRKYKCVPRPCDSHPCRNGGVCTDHVPMFKCTCRDGFNGTQCEQAHVIMLIWDGRNINLKLVIGLSSFIFVLALATLLIICYHRFQVRGKATFNPKRTPKKKLDVKKPMNGFMVVETGREPDKKPRTNFFPSSMYAHTEQQVHTCQGTSAEPPPLPPRSDSLQTNVQLPTSDIPPIIDIVLPSDYDSSPDYDDYISEDYISECLEQDEIEDEIEEPCEQNEMHNQRYAEEGPMVRTSPEQPSVYFEAGSDNNAKSPMVLWSDLGRKFFTMTRDYLVNDDETRPASGISTTSNSSSAATVVEKTMV